MSKIKQNFFLDVFNNILDYNNSKVIIIFDIDSNIWFGFKDILKILEYTSTIKQLQILNINN